MLDLVQRLEASSCSENCLMGKAAKEIERLRKFRETVREIMHDANRDLAEIDDALALSGEE